MDLHALSGKTVISETTVKDKMPIDAQNAKGGVPGKKRSAIMVNPASDRPLFPQKAREPPTLDKIAIMLAAGPDFA